MADQNMPNTGWAMHTRKGKRHAVPRTKKVYVDFDDPRSARRWRVRLLNVSDGGLSFPSVDGRPGVHKGDVLRRAVIHFGDLRIVGELEVTYTTESADRRCVCGASFEAETESDRSRMRNLISRLSAAEEECDGLCPENLEIQL